MSWKAISLFIIMAVAKSEILYSQDKFPTIEAKTLKLYMDQKWDSLIRIGRIAQREGIDYYYLQLRIGMAHFQKKAYILASAHFNDAFAMNSSDLETLKYLYLSCLYSNRPDDARSVSSKLPDWMKTELKVEKKIIGQVDFEGGPTFSQYNKIEDHPYLMKKDSIWGEKDLYGNSFYGHIGITFNLSANIGLAVCYNYLNFSKIRYFQYARVEDQLDSTTHYPWGFVNHYSWNKVAHQADFPYQVNQHELYMAPTIVIPGGFKIFPSSHLIMVKYNNVNTQFKSRKITDTIFADSITPGYNLYSFRQNNYFFIQKDTSFIDYLFSLMISKDFSVFTAGISASYSKLNSNYQTQLCWSLSYFPLGNLDLYGTSSLTAFFQGSDSRLIFCQTVGGKVFSHLWLEASAVIGDLTNANLFNGYIVYNITDKTDYRLGLHAIIPVAGHVYLSLIYQLSMNENALAYYTIANTALGEIVSRQTENHKYNTNTIIGGLIWKL